MGGVRAQPWCSGRSAEPWLPSSWVFPAHGNWVKLVLSVSGTLGMWDTTESMICCWPKGRPGRPGVQQEYAETG